MGLPILDPFVNFVSETLDVPFSQMNFTISMFLTYPVGFINRYIKSPQMRLYYGLLTGMMLQYQLFSTSIFHVILATYITYSFITFFGRKLSPFYVLFFNILHLSYIHIQVMNQNYGNWSLGIEACYMMSICKFSSIVFNYDDGGKEDSQLKSSHQRTNRLIEKPTLLEVFSYVFYYPTALVGPSFEFSDFRKFIYLEKEYKNINYSKCNKSALENIIWALIFAVILIIYAKASDPNYCITKEYADRSAIFKILYVYFSLIVTRSRYYTAWKLGQGSIDFCGLGYTVKTSEKNEEIISFDKIDVCNLTVMEWSINPRVRLQYWNRSVHLWLKHYLYLRLINTQFLAKKKGLASMLTFLVSALWHGFYPCYYLFFMHYFLIEQVTVFLDEQFDLFNRIDKKGGIIRFVFLQFVVITLKYFGQTFTLLSVKGVFDYYAAFNYIPNILLYSTFIYVTFLHKKRSPTKKIDQ